ncbi:MAG TPA: ADP-glyceromanno-heptose 6-epimerase [Stellaceae bacterium]|jgi:ADP-L-glycero-D-manno-heptose 6-epimerase|nr:ADP-glyceromanno-heptose 6-epimerase [Stellaceae bacterium]
MLVITGGGGFIGSVLAAYLNEAGRSDLVIVDRFGTGDQWRNIAKREFSDILPIEGLLPWLDRHGGEVEAIFHLGANSSTTANDADAMIAGNLNYSIALWRWCTAAGKRLIYASSAATYGDGTLGFDDAGGIEAYKRLQPMNLYGWSKHAFDLWVLREVAAGRAPPFWAGLKFFNVFGPNEYHKGDMTSLVAKNHRAIAAGETIRLFKSYRPEFADGEQRRDFVYVKDCAAVMLWLWRQERPEINGIYNVGTGEGRTFLDFMKALATSCDTALKVEFVDIPPAIRPSYQYFTEARMDRLRQAGYNAPFTPLDAAVRDFVAGYLTKPDPYL